MKTKQLFLTLFASALLVGCGDDVTNIYINPDAGATVNNTSSTTTNNTANYYGTGLDGGAGPTIINNTTVNNYYGGTLDGGAAQAADAIPAIAIDTGSVAIDTKPMIDSMPIPTPASTDKVVVGMKGGERLLDGVSGKFAWVQADGALFALDSTTATVRQINKPTASSGGSMLVYDYIVSLSVNREGKVASITRAYQTMDNQSWVCMYMKLDAEILASSCSVQSGNYAYEGTVAFHDNIIYWAMAVGPNAELKGYWMDVDVAPELRAITPFATSEAYITQLRTHSKGKIGYVAHGQYMIQDIFSSTSPESVASVVYGSRFDHGSTSLIVKGGYNGQYWVAIMDKTGYQTRALDSGYENYTTCTRCVGINRDDTVATWTTNGWLKYQRIDQTDSKAQIIPGVTEFVVEGNNLYYIGPDSAGRTWLYSREVK